MSVSRHSGPPADTVLAAQAGDPAALDDLLAFSLPLVYNIIGHALRGHSDTDDLVQETMLRIVRSLGQLRDPAAFRSWTVTVAIRQVRSHQAELARAPRLSALDEVHDPADPQADFVDLCILRLGLTGQRREVAEATRWLDGPDRELLALWWLETVGDLDRGELAAALDVSSQHAAVRVQRMKQQLDISRSVVRALSTAPRCPELDELIESWDHEPSPLWRKRLGRHIRGCAACGAGARDLVPADGLLVGIGLVPVALTAALRSLTSGSQQAASRGARHAPRPAARSGRGFGVGKVAAIVCTVTAVAAVGAVVVVHSRPAGHAQAVASSGPGAPIAAVASSPAPSTVSAAPSTAPPSKTATPSRSATRAKVPAVTTVDSVKKGAATWDFTGITSALKQSGVSWYYTWGSGNSGIDTPSGVQFVPMIWGGASVTTSTLDQVKKEGSVLLTFNEPDMSSQANMSPQQALALWPQLESTGMELVSPAVATGAATPGGWLDQFMQGARSKGYRVDFIAVHWYGSDFSTPDAVSQLEGYLQAIYNRYHLPLWLTEYALIDFSGGTSYPSTAQQTAFVTASTRMLQGLSYVQRYSWFAFPATTPGQTGLFQPGGAPNPLGAAYEEAGD